VSKVFIVDSNKQQLDPVHPGQARILLNTGKAAIYRKFPFTIILKSVVHDKQVVELRVKLDPGSKATGIAIVNDTTGEAVFAAELLHRGQAIKKRLDKRRSVRRGRHYRHMRYREPRFDNRPRRKGWLPPSLESRIANVLTWVRRFAHVCHITAISMELVKFDLQLMENPEVSGVQYQQGTLAGYELREYLLEKWKRTCAYCGKQHIPLQVEHIVARARAAQIV
jgi:5-methylcytosine-specific restriction endonuclease McrA